MRRGLSVAALLLVVGLGAIAQPPARLTTRQAAALDALLGTYGPDSPGAAVLVARCGETLLERVSGLADVQGKRAVTPETRFRLASVSKQFTAAAVNRLAADGRLSLDDPIGRFVPDLPEWARKPTLRQLLTHTGGLPDYEDYIPSDRTTQVTDHDMAMLLARASGPKLPPGEKFAYSNTGYALLALAVEKASGKTLPAFLPEAVFGPLQMTSLIPPDPNPANAVPRRAFGHSLEERDWKRTDQSLTSAVWGDGGVYASIRDLARWSRALCSLVPQVYDAAGAFEPRVRADRPNSSYGWGWYIETQGARSVVWHTGETMGFRNALLHSTGERLTVAVLTNRNEGEPIETARAILQLFSAPP
jgi:CubicO group peptidase (beta-lactamase class C family)